MTIARYRKKPVVIDAAGPLGEHNIDEIGVWAEASIGHDCLLIDTLEGQMRADLGDYVIRGVSGEHYPCKPDIFERTYEPVGDTHTESVCGRRCPEHR